MTKKSVGFHVRLDPELHAGVRDVAVGLGVSMNELICSILADFVEDDVYILKLRVMKRPDGSVEYQMEIPDGLHRSTGVVDAV